MDLQDTTYTLVLTAATVIDGEIAVAGEHVELSKREAENLLGRGMAKLADEGVLAQLEADAAEEAERIRVFQEEQLRAQMVADQAKLEADAKRLAQLQEMTVDDLKALAVEHNYDLNGATKKDAIITAIQAAEQTA